jgi:hypothetical protein
MRRPEVELSDKAARYVEQHPDAIEQLAAGRPVLPGTVTERQRARFRGYVRERLAAARSAEADAEGQAFLARHSVSR